MVLDHGFINEYILTKDSLSDGSFPITVITAGQLLFILIL